MHIVIATPYLPWPPTSGGAAAQYSTLSSLSCDHSFSIVVPISGPRHAADALALEKSLPGIRVHGVGTIRSEGITRKWLRKIRQTLRQRQSLKSNALHYPFLPLSSDFVEAVITACNNGADLFQAEFAEMMSLGMCSISLPKVFIHHQIHAVYAQRHVKVHGSSAHTDYLIKKIGIQERAYLSEFDEVVVFSNEDETKLTEFLPRERVSVSPFAIPSDISTSGAQSEEFTNFLFLGTEEHGPNRDALAWLLREIWPKICEAAPETKLFVVGNWSEKWIKENTRKGVHFTGFVSDINASCSRKIMLVPLRIGSGIRTKIISAMAMGLPVVTTTVGVEGIEVADEKHLLIRDCATDLANAAIELYFDRVRAKRIATSGRSYVLQAYSAEAVRSSRDIAYKKAIAHRAIRKP